MSLLGVSLRRVPLKQGTYNGKLMASMVPSSPSAADHLTGERTSYLKSLFFRALLYFLESEAHRDEYRVI
jgi:hypothetical protein